MRESMRTAFRLVSYEQSDADLLKQLRLAVLQQHLLLFWMLHT